MVCVCTWAWQVEVSWGSVGKAKAGVPDWSAHSIYEFEFDTIFPSFLLQ